MQEKKAKNNYDDIINKFITMNDKVGRLSLNFVEHTKKYTKKTDNILESKPNKKISLLIDIDKKCKCILNRY